MPSGIVLTSASEGATQEQVEKVFKDNGLEVEKTAVEPEPEPAREAFESEEDFDAAHAAWTEKQEPPAKDEKEDDDPERPKLSRSQRKVQRATADLQRQLAEANERIVKLEKGGKQEPEAPKEEPRPKRAEFKAGDEGQQEYEDALLGWGTKRALEANAAKEAEDATKRQQEETVANYRASVEEFKDKHEDWDEVVNQDLPMHQATQLAIMEQENGADVIYYLGKHPDYTKKLAEMTPLSAVMEVGRLSQRLKTGAPKPGEAPSGADKKPKPQAPPPVRPVSTAATSASLTSRDAASKGDFKAFKQAQRMGR